MPDIIGTLNALGVRIKRYYPDINSGGCCVFAAYVGEQLQRRGYKVNIISAAHDAGLRGKNLEKVRPRILKQTALEWERNGINFNHIGIEVKVGWRWYHYDTDGAYKRNGKLDNMPVHRGRLTVDEALQLSSTVVGWNAEFDRRRMPSIKRHIASYFQLKHPL
jgi:hypothetical protein